MRLSTSWAAVAAGAVGLAVLDGVISRPGATANVGGWLSGAGNAVRWFLSPAVPAFSPSPATGTGAAPLAYTPATSSPPASSASTAPKQPAYVGGVNNPSQQTVAQGGIV